MNKPVARPNIIVSTMAEAIEDLDRGAGWTSKGVPIAVSATIKVGGIEVR